MEYGDALLIGYSDPEVSTKAANNVAVDEVDLALPAYSENPHEQERDSSNGVDLEVKYPNIWSTQTSLGKWDEETTSHASPSLSVGPIAGSMRQDNIIGSDTSAAAGTLPSTSHVNQESLVSIAREAQSILPRQEESVASDTNIVTKQSYCDLTKLFKKEKVPREKVPAFIPYQEPGVFQTKADVDMGQTSPQENVGEVPQSARSPLSEVDVSAIQKENNSDFDLDQLIPQFVHCSISDNLAYFHNKPKFPFVPLIGPNPFRGIRTEEMITGCGKLDIERDPEPMTSNDPWTQLPVFQTVHDRQPRGSVNDYGSDSFCGSVNHYSLVNVIDSDYHYVMANNYSPSTFSSLSSLPWTQLPQFRTSHDPLTQVSVKTYDSKTFFGKDEDGDSNMDGGSDTLFREAEVQDIQMPDA